MPRAVAAVRANVRITEISSCGVRIREYICGTGRAKVRSSYTVVSTATQAAGIHRRDHVDAIGKWAASEVAADNSQRQPAVGPEDASDIPSTDELIEDAIVETEPVTLPPRQVIVEDGVKHMGAIKQRRPILKAGIKARCVGARVILHASQLIERLRESVVQIELQSVRNALV